MPAGHFFFTLPLRVWDLRILTWGEKEERRRKEERWSVQFQSHSSSSSSSSSSFHLVKVVWRRFRQPTASVLQKIFWCFKSGKWQAVLYLKCVNCESRTHMCPSPLRPESSPLPLKLVPRNFRLSRLFQPFLSQIPISSSRVKKRPLFLSSRDFAHTQEEKKGWLHNCLQCGKKGGLLKRGKKVQ